MVAVAVAAKPRRGEEKGRADEGQLERLYRPRQKNTVLRRVWKKEAARHGERGGVGDG